MHQRTPRSILLAYLILLVLALAVFAFGFFDWAKHRDGGAVILAAGFVCLTLVLTTFPIALSAAATARDVQRSLVDKFTPINDTLDQMSVLLNLLSEQQLLTERAKSVAFREKERDTLRRAIQEDIAKQDWEAALALANEIEQSFGYKSEADRFRSEVNQRRSGIVRRQINDAIAGIDRHMRGENWSAAQREADRLIQLYPTDEQALSVPQEIENRRQNHKRQLMESWTESVNRKDVDGAIEILKRLDVYLTPSEAESMQESARGVFKEKLTGLRSQFSAAVQSNRWNDALGIAEEVIRDFPNTQMAKEMREMLPSIRERGGLPQPATV